MNDLPEQLFNDLETFINTPDRFEYLRYWLHRCGITGKKIELKGHRHLLIRFGQHEYSQEKVTKIFVAHYDRVPGTPGANDNSAAVFQLLCHAGRIAQSRTHHNIQILFTDGEELIDGKSPSNQGSYQLSMFLKSNKKHNYLFYVFDMCGIGDCIIMGGSGNLLLEQAHRDGLISATFYNAAKNGVQECIEQIAQFEGQHLNWIYGCFSDDLGFLLGGYPAICISFLPKKEVIIAQENWKKIMGMKETLFSLKKGYFDPEFQKVITKTLPQSWKNRHSADDKIDYLERDSFTLMERFLTFLTECPPLINPSKSFVQ